MKIEKSPQKDAHLTVQVEIESQKLMKLTNLPTYPALHSNQLFDTGHLSPAQESLNNRQTPKSRTLIKSPRKIVKEVASKKFVDINVSIKDYTYDSPFLGARKTLKEERQGATPEGAGQLGQESPIPNKSDNHTAFFSDHSRILSESKRETVHQRKKLLPALLVTKEQALAGGGFGLYEGLGDFLKHKNSNIVKMSSTSIHDNLSARRFHEDHTARFPPSTETYSKQHTNQKIEEFADDIGNKLFEAKERAEECSLKNSVISVQSQKRLQQIKEMIQLDQFSNEENKAQLQKGLKSDSLKKNFTKSQSITNAEHVFREFRKNLSATNQDLRLMKQASEANIAPQKGEAPAAQLQPKRESLNVPSYHSQNKSKDFPKQNV